MSKPIVFVSCGQSTDEEKALGKSVCELIATATAYEPYFAEEQRTFDGLVTNIFGTLARSSAFVAIMHHRGDVDVPGGRLTRGSVWVEQELAIAAFVHHVLKRPLEVALFLQRGIALEGARQQLLLGSTIFDNSHDVLTDLRGRVKRWNLTVTGGKSITAQWRPVRTKPPTLYRHEHQLQVDLVNNGVEMIDEWKAEIWFPSEYIAGADHSKDFVYQCDTDTNYAPERRRIWPGDPPRSTFNVDYFVDTNNWTGRPLWPNEKRAERFVRIRVSGGDHVWEESIPMKHLEEF